MGKETLGSMHVCLFKIHSNLSNPLLHIFLLLKLSFACLYASESAEAFSSSNDIRGAELKHLHIFIIDQHVKDLIQHLRIH